MSESLWIALGVLLLWTAAVDARGGSSARSWRQGRNYGRYGGASYQRGGRNRRIDDAFHIDLEDFLYAPHVKPHKDARAASSMRLYFPGMQTHYQRPYRRSHYYRRPRRQPRLYGPPPKERFYKQKPEAEEESSQTKTKRAYLVLFKSMVEDMTKMMATGSKGRTGSGKEAYKTVSNNVNNMGFDAMLRAVADPNYRRSMVKPLVGKSGYAPAPAPRPYPAPHPQPAPRPKQEEMDGLLVFPAPEKSSAPPGYGPKTTMTNGVLVLPQFKQTGYSPDEAPGVLIAPHGEGAVQGLLAMPRPKSAPAYQPQPKPHMASYPPPKPHMASYPPPKPQMASYPPRQPHPPPKPHMASYPPPKPQMASYPPRQPHPPAQPHPSYPPPHAPQQTYPPQPQQMIKDRNGVIIFSKPPPSPGYPPKPASTDGFLVLEPERQPGSRYSPGVKMTSPTSAEVPGVLVIPMDEEDEEKKPAKYGSMEPHGKSLGPQRRRGGGGRSYSRRRQQYKPLFSRPPRRRRPAHYGGGGRKAYAKRGYRSYV